MAGILTIQFIVVENFFVGMTFMGEIRSIAIVSKKRKEKRVAHIIDFCYLQLQAR